MKKFMTIALVSAIAFLLVSCSGGNEPKDVAKQYLTAVQKGDYKKALDCTATSPEDKERILALIEEKAKQGQQEQSQIEAFEVLNQEIDEEAGTAVVTVSVTKNGQTKEQKLDLVKGDDGKWLLKDAK